MATSSKPEFPPLLGLGFHSKTLEELEELCVKPFVLSNMRPKIMQGLKIIGRRLLGAKIQGELWVDGSFLTEKIDPKDSDVVLALNHEVYDHGTLLQRKTVDWIGSNLKSKHMCDSYVLFEYPNSHPYHAVGEWMRAYWIRQFGFSRSDKPKGIAVFKR